MSTAADEETPADEPRPESPAPLAPDTRVDRRRVIPSHTDVPVAEAATVIGGGLGAHAVVGRSATWTPLRVLFALALITLALGWFGKAGCLQQEPAPSTVGGMQLDRSDQRQFTDLCYSDVVALFGAERLDQGHFPYRTYWFEDHDGETIRRYMEYPVVTGLYMYVLAQAARAWDAIPHDLPVPRALAPVLFFDLAALGLALFWLVTIWATALTARTRIWAAWVAAVSPLVVVHAFTNFDAIATALLALAILSWARRRPWLAGAFIGVGTAAKLYPALLLLALLFLCLRSGRMRAFGGTALAALASWLAVNLPILLLYPRGWYEFFRLNSHRGADSDTLIRLAAKAVGATWDVGVLNMVSGALLILVIIGIALLTLLAPTRPRVAQVMFLLVAGFLLVNKVWSPQYSLWLVPLAVLAIPHTRLLLAWMTVDALVWIPRMTLFLDPDRKWLPVEWFTVIVVVRAMFVLGLCFVVIWQILQPEDDLVRRDRLDEGLGDPAAGVLDDDAADAPVRPAERVSLGT
ncbi:MAG: glycosyltransferase 87 family protein [Gordonia sp. (in: high G+C Gram-positive bacteria)]